VKPEHEILIDSDIMGIVQVVLEEMCDFDNFVQDFDLNVSRYPEFYDLYSKKIIRDEFYSDDYWLDFGSYDRSVADPPEPVWYIYIFILPRYNMETFYIATNYYSLVFPGSFTDRKLEFEIYECRSDDLFNIRYALLHGEDPKISDCRSLGKLKVLYTNAHDKPFEFNIIRIE
jgi:hypothetical protein